MPKSRRANKSSHFCLLNFNSFLLDSRVSWCWDWCAGNGTTVVGVILNPFMHTNGSICSKNRLKHACVCVSVSGNCQYQCVVVVAAKGPYCLLYLQCLQTWFRVCVCRCRKQHKCVISQISRFAAFQHIRFGNEHTQHTCHSYATGEMFSSTDELRHRVTWCVVDVCRYTIIRVYLLLKRWGKELKTERKEKNEAYHNPLYTK